SASDLARDRPRGRAHVAPRADRDREQVFHRHAAQRRQGGLSVLGRLPSAPERHGRHERADASRSRAARSDGRRRLIRAANVPTPPGETRPDPKTATGYSAQWTCREQFESGLLHFVNRIRDRRFVAVDRERGLVFTFVFFDHSGGETRTFQTPDGRTVTAGPAQPWTWYIAEIFKVTNGQIRRIEATLHRVPYGMLSGWSSYEDGMSDKIQDVTM